MNTSISYAIFKGLDIPKHAEPAYPSEAWGDGWGEFLKATSTGLGKKCVKYFFMNLVTIVDQKKVCNYKLLKSL